MSVLEMQARRDDYFCSHEFEDDMYDLAEEFMVRKLLREVVVVGQIADLPDAVNQNDLLIALIGSGIADEGEEGRHARTR